MEEDQEFKHACKFCSKSFPCGRSLGGHMRSHITNLSTETEEKEKLATTKKLLPSLNNGGGGDTGSEAATNAGYGLRENPKKTWRVADSSEDTLVSDKFCKECGKGFHSWKALFGHMKCHSDKERVSNSFEDQDSWTNNNNINNNNASASATPQKLVMDSQSDNEATAPNRRTRSKRKTRCMVSTAATSSVSFAYPSSSSISEVEQEQEEVAMSLMMLSRDVTPWIGLHSVAESSDNYSAYFEAPSSSVRTNPVIKLESNKKITPTLNGSELAKQSDNKKWEFGNSASANPNYNKGKGSASEFSENRFKMNQKDIKFELDSPSALKDSGGELGKNRVNGKESVSSKSATNKNSSMKTKFFGSELKSNSIKTSEGEFSKNSNKRGKFECTTCNKIFHSYQALGGHRASHKKIKGCFASKNESSENSIETDLSPEAAAAATTTESKLMKNSESEYMAEHKLAASFHNEEEVVKESKKSKVHECPICFKVFPSGQALGGHKRSHLVGGSESRNFQTVVVQEPVPEVRDFLDLNLPAATEEESNSHADSNRPWWVVEDNHNHKQEALVGLMSS